MATKVCLICKTSFDTVPYGGSRKFCFACSPSYPKGDSGARGSTITALRQAVKRELVRYKGGKCEICGYDKCVSSLEFHHKDPAEKEFGIARQLVLSNFNIQEYYSEVDKCTLVCRNCHGEIHAENLDR